MADKYLNSNQISVYPSGYRSASVDLEASRTTEGSVRKALLAPLTQKSFAKFEEDNSMTLVLGGYVFNISQEGISALETTFSSAINIYAYIDVQPIATMVDDIESSLKMLVNVETQTSVLDESNLFKGIKFTDTLPNTTTYPNQLNILKKIGTIWSIPLSSKLVIDANKIFNIGNTAPISQDFYTDNLQVGGLESNPTFKADDSNTISMNGHIQLGDDTGFYWGGDAFWITRDSIYLEEGLIYSDLPLILSSKSNKVEIGSNDDFYIDKIKGSNLSLGIDSFGKVYSEDQSSKYTRTSCSGNNIKVISGITQNSMGKITSYIETNLPLASASGAGLVSVGAQTFEGVKTFNQKIVGNIDTADAFSSDATITLSGDVSGTASSTKGWSITTTIGDSKVVTSMIKEANVTTAKIADGNVTNVKLANSSTTIGNTQCTLGSTTLSLSGLTSVYSADFYATSDRRLKENFREVKFNKSILDLPIYKFDFINGAKDQIGCVAQELQEICPELVTKGEDGFLSIQESKLVYLLIDEVKKLKKEVDELKRGE